MIKTVSTLALCCAASIAPALAQTGPEGGANPLREFVAFGAAALPDYSGSDDYRVIPFGAVRLEFGDTVVRTDGPGLAAELYTQGPLTAGVYARWSGGRNDVEDAVVDLLPDVDSSVIAGGFVDVAIARQVISPFDRVSLNAKVGADLLGEFEGVTWSSGISYSGPLSRTSFVNLGLSVSGYSDDYAELLYSVDGAGSAASGLPVYMASGGIGDVGLTGVYAQTVGSQWLVSGVVGWSRLVGDFADSPIVSERGDDNQFLVGVMLGRRL